MIDALTCSARTVLVCFDELSTDDVRVYKGKIGMGGNRVPTPARHEWDYAASCVSENPLGPTQLEFRRRLVMVGN